LVFGNVGEVKLIDA